MLGLMCQGLTEGKGERGESKPIDYIKLADFERLDFINFTEKLRDAFVFGSLSKRRKTFEENLEQFKALYFRLAMSGEILYIIYDLAKKMSRSALGGWNMIIMKYINLIKKKRKNPP